MVRSELVRYVKEQLAKGYRIQDIRRALTTQYSQTDIEDAIHEVYSPKKSMKPLIFAFIGILAIALIVTVLLFATRTTEKIDVGATVKLIAPEAIAGDTIPIEVSLVNSGETKSVTVTIIHELLDKQSTKREIVEVEKTLTKKSELEVPAGLAQGTYVVRTIVEYGEMRKTFENRISIVAVKTASVEKVETPSATKREASKEIVAKKITEEVKEEIEEIRVLSLTNPQRAVERCKELKEKDECQARIAHANDNKIYCEGIETAEIRDNCYMFFSVEGDEQTCASIIDEEKKERCNKIVELKKAVK